MPRTRTPFTTLRTEGAILPADLLQRIAGGEAALGGLTPESYHLSGEKLNEAINRAWNRLQGAWAAFHAAAEKSPPNDPGTTLTRERWLLPLFQELGYGRLLIAKAIEVEGKSYPISHTWGQIPIHLVGFQVELDRRTAGVAGAARSSPHSLLQELLNRSDAHLWGFLSNGLQLRELRDNASLTRQAYVEFDLEAMFTGEVYADFALMWLVCHQSRVEAPPSSPPQAGGTGGGECWLEKWSRAAQQQGTRVLDELRDGVEAAITALGRGFLAHRDNRALRDKLRAGNLTAQDYYRQLLRQVYRLIFLFVAEDRGLLLDPQADPAVVKDHERYTRFYSTARLRRLAERQRGTRHADLFEGLRVVFDLLGGAGNGKGSHIGLPLLGGFLFSPEAVPDLAGCQIANHDLLDAIRSLAFMVEGRTRRAVDYRNLGPEELGSVYESLLELHPVLNTSAATFELQRAGGNERKTTGSHYSPTGLIMRLIDSALEPVIESALAQIEKPRKTGPLSDHSAWRAQAEHALLNLKVCDMACGSGHFLIAAAHRIAKRLAAVRSGEDEPPPEVLRTALRDVIAHCIYGVDVNPMAVELCKVSLWLESLEPGKPLSFLEGRIKCGNSLIGLLPSPLQGEGRAERGVRVGDEIPDEAFNPVAGDHKPTASALKKRNKAERAGQLPLLITVLRTPEDLARFVAERARQLADLPEDTAAQVRAKADEYGR
ncbi:MAG: Eco57I restriction-modification methylase domain-containing protein, partial [Anaerolineales bacterium]